ncbi:hypothetical protein Taro_006963 [Colocasia esculenta]|uniref:Alpha/beta hydrolase fold-3 domain-containing protein n=1 Tax=Colocasia esculenta TaxID=4460 RepID=A0A843TU84_COLES|nr:hypothetical protein [Colocasia esculenta]
MSSSVAAAVETSLPYEMEECRGVLRVFSDGSIVRSANPSFAVPVEDDGSVLWKDVVFDPSHGLALRLYKPAAANSDGKLPVFYYFHGGGFCIGSRTWPNFHNYCLRLAAGLRAVVVAPDYRVGPEHRLPAAIDDGAAAVSWLRSQAQSVDPDTFLAESADFTRVFISGDSAGGNIAHHLAVRYAGGEEELAPVRVRGYVLLMPFFGGEERTRSEAECPADAFLNRELNDRYWRLSLPEGEGKGLGRDHPVANPFGPGSPGLEGAALAPMLVVVGGCDLLRDRAVEYAERLKGWGKPVEVAEFEGQQHGFFTITPRSAEAEVLMRALRHFVAGNSA